MRLFICIVFALFVFGCGESSHSRVGVTATSADDAFAPGADNSEVDEQEQKTLNILVVGDSLSAQNVWASFMKETLKEQDIEVTVDLHAYGGWTYQHHLDNQETLLLNQYDRIFILLGTNDMYPVGGVVQDLNQTMANAETLLGILQQRSPSACVAFLKLPGPSSFASDLWKQERERYNQELKFVMAEKKKVDVLPLLASSTRFRDIVHLHRDAEHSFAATTSMWIRFSKCRGKQ